VASHTIGQGLTEDIECFAGGVADKEAANSPRLVSQWMEDLASQALSRGMGHVYVIDLYRGIRHR
jgi:hypothetical protein